MRYTAWLVASGCAGGNALEGTVGGEEIDIVDAVFIADAGNQMLHVVLTDVPDTCGIMTAIESDEEVEEPFWTAYIQIYLEGTVRDPLDDQTLVNASYTQAERGQSEAYVARVEAGTTDGELFGCGEGTLELRSYEPEVRIRGELETSVSGGEEPLLVRFDAPHCPEWQRVEF